MNITTDGAYRWSSQPSIIIHYTMTSGDNNLNRKAQEMEDVRGCVKMEEMFLTKLREAYFRPSPTDVSRCNYS